MSKKILKIPVFIFATLFFISLSFNFFELFFNRSDFSFVNIKPMIMFAFFYWLSYRLYRKYGSKDYILNH